jgi:hypothetical protein
VHTLILDVIEVMHLKNFVENSMKTASFTGNGDLNVFVYLSLTAALPEFAPPHVHVCSYILHHMCAAVLG